MINKPCAYCGTTETTRHRGHVIAKSLYPSSTPLQTQRPTVPECADCQKIWTDAETHFRNVLLIAGDPNDEVRETWETVERSFGYDSGQKWVWNLYESMYPVSIDGQTRHKVYPYRDERVNLVLRKIVRGLSAYHEIGNQIPDDRVWVGYVPPALGEPTRTERLVYDLGPDFVQYGIALFDDEVEI